MLMDKALKITKEYFPNVTKEELDNILWEYTGFPGFWNIPEDGNTRMFKQSIKKILRKEYVKQCPGCRTKLCKRGK
mgnify:CR=1 FL=1